MKKIIILLVFFAYIGMQNALACTVLIAGKNTTVDGSILFGKTEDDGALNQLDYLWLIPRKIYPAGSVKVLKSGLQIPQVEKTYAYMIDECPQTDFSNMVINEWGVAFGSNGCASKEDPVDVLQKRGDIVNGGIGFDLRFILAERSKTAREAVELAAALLTKYGYNSSGRNLNIVDQHEAWQLQMVAGKHFVARRVKDDEVVIIANTFSIREVNLNDHENFICSPDLIKYAIDRGWYDPGKGKEFDFAVAYAPESAHLNPSNNHRQWIMGKLLNEKFISLEEAEAGLLPVSVIPDHKISVKDMTRILRNHYEGTPLDKSGNYEVSPHYTLQTICRYNTHRTTIVQQRSWLPLEIGTLCWRALGEPCNSVFIPWYLGVNKIPETYQPMPVPSIKIDVNDFSNYHFNIPDWKIQQIDLNSAAKAFWLLGYLADNDYAKNHEILNKEFSLMEDNFFKTQNTFEKEVLNLYNTDKKKAIELLNEYSTKWATKAYNIALKEIRGFVK